MTMTVRKETYKTLAQILLDEPLPQDNSRDKMADYVRRIIMKLTGGRFLAELTHEGGQDHANLTNLAYATAAHTGFEPTVTKGNLTASSPIEVSGSRQVIGGAADISVKSGYTVPTTTEKGNYDTAYTNTHTHTNKATLDSIQEALTTALKGNYDSAYSAVSAGLASQVIALAKLTPGGADGSFTVTNGVVTAYTAPT